MRAEQPSPFVPAEETVNLSILAIWHVLNTRGLMVRRRAQRARLEPWAAGSDSRPSFETPSLRSAPQDEVGVCERFTGSCAGTNGEDVPGSRQPSAASLTDLAQDLGGVLAEPRGGVRRCDWLAADHDRGANAGNPAVLGGAARELELHATM